MCERFDIANRFNSKFIDVRKSYNINLDNHVTCKIHVFDFNHAIFYVTSLRNRYYIHFVCIFHILFSALFASRYELLKTELHDFSDAQH